MDDLAVKRRRCGGPRGWLRRPSECQGAGRARRADDPLLHDAGFARPRRRDARRTRSMASGTFFKWSRSRSFRRRATVWPKSSGPWPVKRTRSSPAWPGWAWGECKRSGSLERTPREHFGSRRRRPARLPGAGEIDEAQQASIDARPEADDRPQRFQGVQLAAKVTLLLGTSRTLDDKDLEALRLASRPLIDLLTRLEIIPPSVEGDPR